MEPLINKNITYFYFISPALEDQKAAAAVFVEASDSPTHTCKTTD
jgi:hypothetical protein